MRTEPTNDKWIIVLSNMRGGGTKLCTFTGSFDAARDIARSHKDDDGWDSWEVEPLDQWFLYNSITY